MARLFLQGGFFYSFLLTAFGLLAIPGDRLLGLISLDGAARFNLVVICLGWGLVGMGVAGPPLFLMALLRWLRR